MKPRPTTFLVILTAARDEAQKILIKEGGGPGNGMYEGAQCVVARIEALSAALSGKLRKPPKPPDVDLLSDLPILDKYFLDILSWIKTAHPKTNRVPSPSDKRYWEWRNDLAALVISDGFKENEVYDCLRWVFFDEKPNNGFCWRDQVCAIPPLRARKREDDLTKFQKIFNSWIRNAGGIYRNQTRILTPKEAAGMTII